MSGPPFKVGNQAAAKWPPAHHEALKRLLSEGFSRAESAVELNKTFGTTYTRHSCIGRAWRSGTPSPDRPPAKGPTGRQRASNTKRREKRWAANPSLRERWERLQQQKQTRSMMIANGATPTMACYRAHLPRLPEMTKSELRAMLTAAVRNTAAMELTT